MDSSLPGYAACLAVGAAAGYCWGAASSARVAVPASPPCCGEAPQTPSAVPSPQKRRAKDASKKCFDAVSIGTARSPFADRNGTPRQPGVVASSRCTVRLHTTTSPTTLRGLSGYSHVHVLFHFHLNTNADKPQQQYKAVVEPPRGGGCRVGVFACRTPHRVNPIGLSLAEIVSVDEEAGVLVLAGLDVVDHTPIIDIKPYIPYAECPDAGDVRCPVWVRESYLSDSAFKKYATVFSPGALQDLEVFEDAQAATCTSLRELIEDTLRIDFRSTRQQAIPQFEGSLRLQKVTVRYTLDTERQHIEVTEIAKAGGEGDGEGRGGE
eukprot:Rhum_TRINITY_DN13214_c0_g1::Rhum_TRINITY_DN13214_c0_g1_i1::g.58211::m.58211